MTVTMVGGDALVTKDFWQITGAAGEGALMTFASDPRKRPAAAKVVQSFKAKNIDPEGYVLYTYAAVQIWAAAAEKLEEHRPEEDRRCHEGLGPLADRAGPDQLRQEGRCDRSGLCVLRVEERQLRRNLTCSGAISVPPSLHRQQPKGGDPVSHCSQAGAAAAAWIIVSATAGMAS